MKKKYSITLLIEGDFESENESKVIDVAADIESALSDKLFDCPGNLKLVRTWLEEEE